MTVLVSMNLFDLLYGNSYRSQHIKALAKKTVEILKKESLSPNELLERLDIGLKPSKKPKRLFYKVINPLKVVGIVALKRTSDNKPYYTLTPDAFRLVTKQWYNQIKGKI